MKRLYYNVGFYKGSFFNYLFFLKFYFMEITAFFSYILFIGLSLLPNAV